MIAIATIFASMAFAEEAFAMPSSRSARLD
jgi:hypothetical protein